MKQKTSNYTRDKMRRLAKEERNRRILELHKAGKTHLDIAEILNISRKTVSTVIKANIKQLTSDEKKAKIIEYREKGLKVDEICKILGISKQTYYNILKR